MAAIDVYMLDTAGRLSIAEELMQTGSKPVRECRPTRVKPRWLSRDPDRSRTPYKLPKTLTTALGISGVVLPQWTAIARGGAALSIAGPVTGNPFKVRRLGEKMDALETF